MKVSWIIVIVVLVFSAAWGWARWELSTQVDDFRMAVRDQNFNRRGGFEMTEDEAEAAIRNVADVHHMQVVSIDVHMEPLTDANRDRADAVTRMVEDRAADAVEQAREGGAAGMGSGDIGVTGTLIEIVAEVRAKKWLWSTSERIEDSRVMNRQMVIDR